MPIEKATYLDIILYSRDQIMAESAAMGTADPTDSLDYDYAIVWIKA